MSRPRVLIADDHRMVAEALKVLLAPEFDLVAVVEDGIAMVEAAKRLRPQVVVSDVTMPHLNGLDAVAQLKKDNPSIKVVFLTMHGGIPAIFGLEELPLTNIPGVRSRPTACNRI
jgi:DNA-binding NarL/FixJ family response regulator